MADRTIKPDDTNDLVLQNNHGDSKIEVNEDDTVVVTSGGNITLDATGDIILDADGDITLSAFPAGCIVNWTQLVTTPVALQGTDATYTDLTGSSVSYTPPAGASYVVYEYTTTIQADGTASPYIQLLKFMYDGSMVANANWSLRQDDSLGNMGYQHLRFILPAWSEAKTMSVQYRKWGTNYDCSFHKSLRSGEATTTAVFTKIYQSTYSIM